MVGQYLKTLEKYYGYTGNWQPNESVQVGDWADVELGFLPWLKEFLGIGDQTQIISKNLHSVMAGTLGDIEVKEEKRASVTLSHNVSISMSESCQAVSVKAQKKGGFFAVFQNMYETNAESASFRDKLDTLDKTSVAVVSGDI